MVRQIRPGLPCGGERCYLAGPYDRGRCSSPDCFENPSFCMSLPALAPPVAARFERLKQRPVSLSVRGLTKHFESPRGTVTALRDVSFDVHKREFMSVIG